MFKEKRKTCFEVDFEKVAAAKAALGTHTLTETVDAALDEVVKRAQRQRLIELLSDGKTIDNEVLQSDVWG